MWLNEGHNNIFGLLEAQQPGSAPWVTALAGPVRAAAAVAAALLVHWAPTPSYTT